METGIIPKNCLSVSTGFPRATERGLTMGMRLDGKTVAALKPKVMNKELVVFDNEIRQFGMRVRYDKDQTIRKAWICRYKIGTAQFRPKIGDYPVVSAEAARKAAKDLLAKVQLGGDPQAERKQAAAEASITVLSIIDQYLERKKKDLEKDKYRASSLTTATLYLKTGYYFKPLHSKPINAVEKRDVAIRINEIESKSGAATASQCRAILSAFFVWAVKEGIADSNPVIDTNNPATAARDRVLENDELVRIWNGCQDDDFGRIIKLLALTGCRCNEIAFLRWSEIVDGEIRLPKERVKNKHPHSVPITPLMESILESIPRRPDRDFVFGSKADGYDGFYHAQVRLEERIGKLDKPWTPHDLRRTVATRMADRGVFPHVIEAALNHLSGAKKGVVGTYNRSKYAQEVKTALGMWSDHVWSLVNDTERKVIPLRMLALGQK
jgi:integrase